MRISKEGKGESCSVQSSCAALLHKTNNVCASPLREVLTVRSYQDAFELPDLMSASSAAVTAGFVFKQQCEESLLLCS